MVLDAALLSTQNYKVSIKGKVEQSWEWSSTLPYTSVLYLLKKEPLGHPRLRSPTLLTYFQLSKGMFMIPKFLLMMSLCLGFSLPDLRGPSSNLEYGINFGNSVLYNIWHVLW